MHGVRQSHPHRPIPQIGLYGFQGDGMPTIPPPPPASGTSLDANAPPSAVFQCNDMPSINIHSGGPTLSQVGATDECATDDWVEPKQMENDCLETVIGNNGVETAIGNDRDPGSCPISSGCYG